MRSGFIPGVLGIAAFGLTLPFTRIAVLGTSSIDVFIYRLVLASVLATLVLVVARCGLPSRQQWLEILLVCAGVVFGFPLFTSLAMASEASAHGGVVLGVLPLATAVAANLLNRERSPLIFWIAAITGSLLVLVFSLWGGIGSLGVADLWLFLAIISAAVGYAVGGRLSREMPAWQVISWALTIALPVAVVLLLLFATPFTELITGTADQRRWLLFAFLYLGLISQYGGFLLWYRALALDGVARASQIQLIQPFFTLVGAAVLLDEPIGIMAIVFAVLISLTIVVSRHASAVSGSGSISGVPAPASPDAEPDADGKPGV